MATGSDNLEVDIDERSSALVHKQRDSFKEKLDIEQFVEYIGHVGHFIKIAYNGVNAAGPRFTDLQIEVQKLGFDIAKLYDDSSVTIDHFQETASTVSLRLESVHQFLLDGSDNAAVTTVTSLNELAQKMIEITSELKVKFEEQEKKVEDILEKAMRTKSVESKGKWEQLEKEQKEMEQKMQEQEKLANRYDRLVREVREKMTYDEEKEERQIEEKNDGPGLIGVFTGAILKAVIPFAAEAIDNALYREERESAENPKSLEDIAKEKREIELQQQNLYHEALQKMREFVSKLKNVKSEGEIADIVIEALHKTSGALRHLSLIMTEASRFWTYILDRCNSLSDKNFKDLMWLLNSKDEETKKKFWSGQVFTKESETYNSRWLALRSACEVHKRLIDATRADLYEHIKDNPTYEQSLKRLPQLMQDFLKIIDEEKKKNEKRGNMQLTDK